MTVQEVRDTIATTIAESGAAVKEAVVAFYADKEKQRRVDLIVRGINKLAELEGALKKIDRPDKVLYKKDRTIDSESYSKEALDAIDKATKNAEKVGNALTAAIDTPSPDNFKKLEDQVKGGGDN